jgi:hypothetical protein
VLVRKTGSGVLPVFISGTPVRERAWDSLFATSRSKLIFGPVMEFEGEAAGEIVARLEAWFAARAITQRVDR